MEIQPEANESAATRFERRQQLHTTRILIWLLAALCAVSLAALPLNRALVAPVAAPPRTTTPRYLDGTCTAQPQSIHYSQPVKASSTSKPPAQWTKAGKSTKAFTLAQACAAAFTLSYESFDATQLATLASATSMMSIAAQQRFDHGTPQQAASQRVNATWQAQARLQHLQQSALIPTPATLQRMTTTQGLFSATFQITYNLTIQANGKISKHQQHLLVVLSTLANSANQNSTGWQVTDWIEAARA